MNRIIYKEGSDKLLYICISFTLIYVVMKKIIIAIDGVSSTGKSTMAKRFGKGAGIYLYRYRGDVPGCHFVQFAARFLYKRRYR